jgi:hypothetical protein
MNNFIRKTSGLVVLMAIILAIPSVIRAGDTLEDILNRRTAFQWNRDYLAWAVHYPDYIVEPWVKAATGGGGDPSGKMASEFKRSLKLESSTPVLLSLHCYTDRVISLKPFSERFMLRTSDGKMLPPDSYDSIFDSPLSGLVQGLVFFPETEGPFELVLKAEGSRERVFEFPEDRYNRVRKEAEEKLKRSLEADSMESAQKRQALIEEESRKAVQEAREEWEKERKKFHSMMEDANSRNELLRKKLDETMAELARLRMARQEENNTAELFREDPRPDTEEEKQNSLPGFAREQVVQMFVTAWKLGDHEEMTDLMSPAFREEIQSAGGLDSYLKEKVMPQTLPQDAKIRELEDPEKTEIVYAQKFLVMRALKSAEVGLFESETGWFISGLK